MAENCNTHRIAGVAVSIRPLTVVIAWVADNDSPERFDFYPVYAIECREAVDPESYTKYVPVIYGPGGPLRSVEEHFEGQPYLLLEGSPTTLTRTERVNLVGETNLYWANVDSEWAASRPKSDGSEL